MEGEQQVALAIADEWAWDAARNPLPRSADVAIIGGGIVGCSAAYFLAKQGVSVALFEKGRVAGEQSGRNWGWVRQQGRSPDRAAAHDAQPRPLAATCAEDLGEDIGFKQGGSLYLAEDSSQLAELEQWLVVARAHDLDTRLLSARGLEEVLKSDANRWAGALYTASDARAEPSRATAAIARGARRAGAQVFTPLCGSRYRACCRSRARSRHRAWECGDSRGRLRGRRVDEIILRLPRDQRAAAHRTGHGRAHRADQAIARRAKRGARESRSVAALTADTPSRTADRFSIR